MDNPLLLNKKKYPAQQALEVAKDIVQTLRPFCERIEIAGSLRRRKPQVSDIEILYISTTKTVPDPEKLFETMIVQEADERIRLMEKVKVLERRLNVNGREMYGAKNKLMQYMPDGIPVDLFAATAENWWNYLVCRTGPKESNIAIAAKARERGWRWHPYGQGFSRAGNHIHKVTGEEDVFRFVGLDYKEPWDR